MGGMWTMAALKGLMLQNQRRKQKIMKHSKEPWRVDVQYPNNDLPHIIIKSCSGESVGKSDIASILAYNPKLVPYETQNANSARIVACVNACEGIKNEDLQRCANNTKVILSNLEEYDRLKDTVRQMREAQKSYFATRAVGHLQESKRLEQLVDALLSNQTTLF